MRRAVRSTHFAPQSAPKRRTMFQVQKLAPPRPPPRPPERSAGGRATNNCSRPWVEVDTEVPMESAPRERNRCQDGSTNHHLPSIFSTRKKPVALAFEPS